MGIIHINRSSTAKGLKELIEKYPKELGDLVPEVWLSDFPTNICLTDDENNWAFFHKGSDDIYDGHYFFEVRGRSALNLAKEMLNFFFRETGERVLRGRTPLQKLGARWMSRQLGFKSQGVIYDEFDRPCELFILVREDN